MKNLDNFLNQITMYKLVLYFLIILVVAAESLSFLGLLPFSPLNLSVSVIILGATCWLVNTFFSHLLKVPVNSESYLITALILSLILTPAGNLTGVVGLSVAGVVAMTSKFILAISRKHLFNPAALAVAVTGLVFSQYASWWVGTTWMAPFVLVGGLLVLRKIKRFTLVSIFWLVSLAMVSGYSVINGQDLAAVLSPTILETPVLFFSMVMLIEPQTSPVVKRWQIVYGVLVGALFTPGLHLGQFFITPEIALLLGNIFSFLTGPKEKLILKLKQKREIAKDTYQFIFAGKGRFSFAPGQYLEWTCGHQNADIRGNRRYFTIASSPTEGDLQIGIKFFEKGSSFKKALMEMKVGELILAGQLAGDFILPKDASQKLVFLAGGIGVTPFRSMVKYLTDKNEIRDIVLLYSNKVSAEVAYKELFDLAVKKLGIKVVYVQTDKQGFIDEQMIKVKVPDFKERVFYISGPHSMVEAFQKTLQGMGITGSKIKVDFFPGYA